MTVLISDPPLRVVFQNIRWQTYEYILADLGDRPVRLTYDRGELEIMSPSKSHEWFGCLVGRMIETLTLERGIPIQSVKSTTWRSALKQRGLEADESYYIQSEPRVRGKLEFDPGVDPVPDLVVEIEISRSVLDRLGIYAALGIREIWRYDGEKLTAHVLDAEGGYREVETSAALPALRVRDLERFLQRATLTDETSLMREFLVWVRDRRPAP